MICLELFYHDKDHMEIKLLKDSEIINIIRVKKREGSG
ncbi:Uncharacterised protein [Staphylococcus xylosus]|nr:Uncharacterised protein [Staphylococcus xylosus]